MKTPTFLLLVASLSQTTSGFNPLFTSHARITSSALHSSNLDRNNNRETSLVNDNFIQEQFESKRGNVDGRVREETSSDSARVLGPMDVLIYDTTLRGEF